MPEPLHHRPDLYDCEHVGYDFPEHDELGVMIDLYVYPGKIENYVAYMRVGGQLQQSRVYSKSMEPDIPRFKRVYDAWQHSLREREYGMVDSL